MSEIPDTARKKPGPKPKYVREKAYQDGAPLLTTRIDPGKLEFIKARPEGVRPYIERIVGEDMQRESADEAAE